MNDVIFGIIRLLCGLAFFLYGMDVMSGGLKKMAGGKLEQLLKKVTSNPATGILLGAVITIAIQSSSAMTVMLVGLVNSSIMELGQTVCVIFGSNIGTTVTAWITSLSALSGENLFINLLKPANFSGILAFIGIVMIVMSKKPRRRDIGTIFVGFAILMFGMDLMSGAVKPLSESESFIRLLTLFNNPIIGVLVGAAFTGIIQSSAASIGILQALSLTGNISYSMAIPIVMGLNIGTCATALISSIGVNKKAKRVAIVHVTIKIIGTVVFMILLYGAQVFVSMPFMNDTINPFGIALCHTVFNILNTIILLPFPKMLERIANLIVRDNRSGVESDAFVDERLLLTPSVAISECYQKTVQMAEMAHSNIISAIKLGDVYDTGVIDEIEKKEEIIDTYEDKLGTSLVKVSLLGLSEADGKKISTLLHTIGDFERIGDHAVNMVKSVREMHDKNLRFSESARNDLNVLNAALSEILDMTMGAFAKSDLEMAKSVEPLEQVIDRLITKVKNKHIERLQQGECTIEMGFVLSDILTNFERVSDHCSNIAVALIEVNNNSFDTHEYLGEIKEFNNEFKEKYKVFMEKYTVQ